MAVNYNPSIATNGLVVCLDADNPKSYPGTGNTLFNVSGTTANGTATTITTADLSVIGQVLNYNTSTAVTSTFASPINHESWSLIYWLRSTGLTSSNYRGVIQLIEPNAPFGYFFNVDTRETTNSYILAYQKNFLVDDWLVYGYMTAAQWAAQGWWCLGVSHNYGVFKFYTNGALANTQTQTRNVAGYGDLTSMRLNYSTGNTVYLGPVQFYQTVLSDQQFNQNFQALRGRFGI